MDFTLSTEQRLLVDRYLLPTVRGERIWDGTSEIQRHIISRALLRPLGG